MSSEPDVCVIHFTASVLVVAEEVEAETRNADRGLSGRAGLKYVTLNCMVSEPKSG